MNGIEAIGDAVTGGMIAGAVEPAAGKDGGKGGGTCRNCGCTLTGAYCHCCGQKGEVHRTLGAFWHDLIHGVFHFEGKTWRTLPLLAWRPGELTRRYIAGERASFVSPMALFLFSVFLMFVVVSWVGGPTDIDTTGVRDGIRADVTQAEGSVRDLEAERAKIVAVGGDTRAVDAKLDDAREAAELEKAIAQDGARGAAMRISDDVPDWVAGPLRRAADNPELVLYKLQNNAYKFSWLLIPLSVPLLWLLFLHRRRYRQFNAYDHTVFVTYSIAFMSIGLVALSLLRLVGVAETPLVLAIFLVPPVHIFRQLRGAYSLSAWSALWRTLALICFAIVAAVVFLMVLVLIGAIS